MVASFGVAIVWSGRAPLLLDVVLRRWAELNAKVVVAAPATDLSNLRGPHQALVHSTKREEVGNARQAALEAFPENICVIPSDDDVLPLGETAEWCSWMRNRPDNAISALRLISVLEQRWCDWAYFDGVQIRNQEYHQRLKATYITGPAQVIPLRVRQKVSYRGLRFHEGDDITYCRRAEEQGFVLLPPTDAPISMHLDRLPPHPSDPERLHIPIFGV